MSFLATLALVAILSLARSAQASSLTAPPAFPTPAAAFRFEEDEEEGEEEFEAEECEEGEEGEEECADEGKGGGSGDGEAGPEAPRECLLSSAQTTIAASTDNDRLRMQVRYSISSPATVAVEYGLHGRRGSLFLGGEKERFAKRGVLHLTRRLTDAQMAKVLAAKGFTVRLHVLAAPSYCHPFFDRQLNVRRLTPRGPVWSQSP